MSENLIRLAYAPAWSFEAVSSEGNVTELKEDISPFQNQAPLVGPKVATAQVDFHDAEVLEKYDHCWVKVGGTLAILISRDVFTDVSEDGPFHVTALMNPAPNHATSWAQIREIILKHPRAPQEIQMRIDRLDFR